MPARELSPNELQFSARRAREPKRRSALDRSRQCAPVPCHRRRERQRLFYLQGFSMGGTGLEPVTPSLSRRSSGPTSSSGFTQSGIVERNRSASERLTERERTPNVAIVATA